MLLMVLDISQRDQNYFAMRMDMPSTRNSKLNLCLLFELQQFIVGAMPKVKILTLNGYAFICDFPG
jgi:hypothetical protein